MSSTDPFSWGAETLERAGGGRSRPRASRRRVSLLGARAQAVVVDGLVLVAPLFAIVYLLSRAFPHLGFAASIGGSSGSGLHVGVSAALVVSALSLSYFFVFEALRGQTIGKRLARIHVRAAGGGPAGLNAISARTVLRLIDGLAVYLVGA